MLVFYVVGGQDRLVIYVVCGDWWSITTGGLQRLVVHTPQGYATTGGLHLSRTWF
jgi:hypothetical protein